MWTSGLCLGLMGPRTSFIPASFGVRPPFLTLQAAQAQTILCQVDLPPILRGMTWSSESSLVAKRLPQYWHLFLSRAKMFRRLNFTSFRGRRSKNNSRMIRGTAMWKFTVDTQSCPSGSKLRLNWLTSHQPWKS